MNNEFHGIIDNLNDDESIQLLKQIVDLYRQKNNVHILENFQFKNGADVLPGKLSRSLLHLIINENSDISNLLSKVIERKYKTPSKSSLYRKKRQFELIDLAYYTALIVPILQTHVKFEINHKKKWKLSIEKKAGTSEFIDKILKYLSDILPCNEN